MQRLSNKRCLGALAMPPASGSSQAPARRRPSWSVAPVPLVGTGTPRASRLPSTIEKCMIWDLAGYLKTAALAADLNDNMYIADALDSRATADPGGRSHRRRQADQLSAAATIARPAPMRPAVGWARSHREPAVSGDPGAHDAAPRGIATEEPEPQGGRLGTAARQIAAERDILYLRRSNAGIKPATPSRLPAHKVSILSPKTVGTRRHQGWAHPPRREPPRPRRRAVLC